MYTNLKLKLIKILNVKKSLNASVFSMAVPFLIQIPNTTTSVRIPLPSVTYCLSILSSTIMMNIPTKMITANVCAATIYRPPKPRVKRSSYFIEYIPFSHALIVLIVYVFYHGFKCDAAFSEHLAFA